MFAIAQAPPVKKAGKTRSKSTYDPFPIASKTDWETLDYAALTPKELDLLWLNYLQILSTGTDSLKVGERAAHQSLETATAYYCRNSQRRLRAVPNQQLWPLATIQDIAQRRTKAKVKAEFNCTANSRVYRHQFDQCYQAVLLDVVNEVIAACDHVLPNLQAAKDAEMPIFDLLFAKLSPLQQLLAAQTGQATEYVLTLNQARLTKEEAAVQKSIDQFDAFYQSLVEEIQTYQALLLQLPAIYQREQEFKAQIATELQTLNTQLNDCLVAWCSGI